MKSQPISLSDSFLSELKESIELTERKNTHKPSKKYKPSSMNCIRNMYFQIIGEEITDDSRTYSLIGISECGTDRHIRIQAAVSAMRENGFDCDYLDVGEYVVKNNIPDLEIVGKNGAETHLYNKRYNISFACDGIIRYNGQLYIIEFKTEGSKKFISRKSVDDFHINQASAYSLSLGISDVLFIYISRDTLEMKAYILNVTDTMRERIMSKIDMCDMYVERGVVPPAEQSYKVCQYCQYKTKCESIKNNLILPQ